MRLRAAQLDTGDATFPVRAEVDNPGPGSSLEIVLGRSQSGSFEPEEIRRFPTAQHRRIGFAPGGPDGALLFEAAADDWSTTLDLTGIEGSRLLRARLLDADGNEVEVVSQPLLIDNSRPAGPSFIELPAGAARIKASGQGDRPRDRLGDRTRPILRRPAARGGAALPATVTDHPGSPDPEGVIWSAGLRLARPQGTDRPGRPV